MGAQQPEPQTTVVFRINSLEQGVAELKKQLNLYVPIRENDLQLKSIRDIVERIEYDVHAAKRQLEDVSNKLSLQENESQKRDAEQRESQAQLQIKALWGVVSLILAILTGVLVGYITHFFH